MTNSALTSLFFLPGFLAFGISLVVTFLTIKIYRRFGWVDDPQTNSHIKVTHRYPVPRGGGIPIFVSLLLIGAIFLGFDKHFIGIILGALVLTLVGVLDDIWNLSPYLRLVSGSIASLLVVGSGIGIAYITNPLIPGTIIHLSEPQITFSFLGSPHTIWILADLFAIIWIVWTQNIVNWSKGVDGQMPGFVGVAAIFLGLLSLRFVDDITQWEVARLSAITAGAYFGFLIFNFYPQKIMPGYGGGSLAGYLLAILSILSGAKVAALILVLCFPMTDAAYTIARRIFRGRSPVWGDRGHLHHRLLDLGFSKRQIALFYWCSTLIFGILSLSLNSTQKLFTIITSGLVFGGLILWLKYFKTNLSHPQKNHHTSQIKS